MALPELGLFPHLLKVAPASTEDHVYGIGSVGPLMCMNEPVPCFKELGSRRNETLGVCGL